MSVRSSADWRKHSPVLFLLAGMVLGPCLWSHAQVFQNVASSWGVTQYDWDGIYGAAVSTADWNDDGWPDLTLGTTDGALRAFVNQGGNGFGLVPLPWMMQSETKALLWVDLDNDGDDDLFIQEESGRCGLIRNDGPEGFVDVTETSNLPQDATEAAGVSLGDMDNDGDLDLHLCRYLEYPLNNSPADRNVLLRNNGDLTFTDVTEGSGIDIHLRLSFQSIWWDEDGDGLQDVFVINDKNGANAMFQNQGDGTFIDVAGERNMALVMDCMTATLGDFNQDSRQDLFLTNTPLGGDGLGSKLLQGLPDGTYEEVSSEHGLAMDRYCWGAVWMDVDNDTDLDLFVAEHEFLQPYGINYLYQNLGAEEAYNFEPFGIDVYDVDYLNSHVVASADFDRNGWIDFVMHNVGNHATRVWLNNGFDNGYSSVGISLQGTWSNRPGVGSRIDLLTSNGLTQSRITHAGENYLSQENETELFGLGNASVESVTVQWPSGLLETFDAEAHGLAAMDNHVLVEGHSPCPEVVIAHSVCADSTVLELNVNADTTFVLVWTDASGQAFAPETPWTSSNGDLTMTSTWQGVATCTVTHIVTWVNPDGDLDDNGIVGATDIVVLLSELGCSNGCAADLNADGSVGVVDLLALLSHVGQSCF